MTIKSNLLFCSAMILALQNSIAMNPAENFDLDEAIRTENIEALKSIEADFSARLNQISQLMSLVQPFVDTVESDALKFEDELSKEKGISKDKVQNLSHSHRDFFNLSAPAKRAEENFTRNMGKAFPGFQAALRARISALQNSSLASLIPALKIFTYAAIPCPGCADSMYRYALLFIELLKAYQKNPYMTLPQEINNIYTQIQDYADGYCPHAINIGATLSVLKNELIALEADRNIRLSDSDISTIVRYANIFSQEGVVGSNIEFFDLINRIKAVGNMSITDKTLGTCMDEIYRSSAPDELKNIMKMLVLQRVRLQQERAKSGSKISEARKAMFETQADSKSQTENKAIGKLSKDRLSVFSQSKDSSTSDKPAPKKLDMSKFSMFQNQGK